MARLHLLTIAACASIASAASAALDSRLYRSFYGLAYSPDGVILPECGATQQNVTRDVALIAQLTPRVRIYAGDCNQTALVMQGIQDTNADLTVYPSIYIGVPYNQTVVDRQLAAIVSAIQTYGEAKIGGITVGNEFLLNSYGDSGTPTDSAGVTARKQLLSTIKSVNQTIQNLKLSKSIPIGTSDAGSALTEDLCTGIDYYLANDHPWFGSVPINQAAGWTWQFFEQNDAAVCAKAANNPTMYIGETGWPSQANASQFGSDGPSTASDANLQTFLDTFVCQSNTNNTNYFYFEFSDQPWTLPVYGGVEPYWGLFDSSRNLKDITIPNCPVDSPTGGTVSQLQSPESTNTGVTQGTTHSSSAGQLQIGLITSAVLVAACATLL